MEKTHLNNLYQTVLGTIKLSEISEDDKLRAIDCLNEIYEIAKKSQAFEKEFLKLRLKEIKEHTEQLIAQTQIEQEIFKA